MTVPAQNSEDGKEGKERQRWRNKDGEILQTLGMMTLDKEGLVGLFSLGAPGICARSFSAFPRVTLVRLRHYPA